MIVLRCFLCPTSSLASGCHVPCASFSIRRIWFVLLQMVPFVHVAWFADAPLSRVTPPSN